MHVPSKSTLTRLVSAAPAAMLRAGCVALFICVSACSGGDDGTPPSSSVPAPAPAAAPNPPPPASAPGPTQPSSALALSIDSAASGNPVGLRVALSANGDGFAVWRAHDGTRHNLWANRYRASNGAWGNPVNIEASSTDIDDFDLAADGSGNAVVAWHEVSLVEPRPGNNVGVVMSARFDAGAGAWAMPVLLNSDANQPRVASNATGAVLAVYVFESRYVRGRFFDPAGGTWQPEAAIEQNTYGTGASLSPVALVDGSGNALAVWPNTRTGVMAVGSSYFSRSTGGWPQLPPGEIGSLGGIPGSFIQGSLTNLQLTASTGGNFLAVWQTHPSEAGSPGSSSILITRFTSSTQKWSAVQTLVPNSAQSIQLQRIGSDAGKALLLWTESVGARTALKAIRVDDAGAACSVAQVIDSAVGGGAARADLGVDPQGHAIAIWQQFEGGRADDGSRSNIAINRFDGATSAWAGAVFAETQPGNATEPRASVSGGQALLGWIQSEGGANRVKARLQPLADTLR